MREITTYRDLLDYLGTLTANQLDQDVMIMQLGCGDEPIPLESVYAVGTVAESEADTRSAVDNEHHPGQIVLLRDWNMFDEDGSIGEDLMTGERIFSRRGRVELPGGG